MSNKNFFLIFCFLSNLLPCVFASEPVTLEEIVVRPGSDSAATDSAKNNYSVETITALEIKEKKLNTLVDLLEYVAGMDLRYRGTSGVQGDLSLRGSTYEQVAVVIDGVRVNDPQTGHHNLDIPLTIFDVERVEVTKEGFSSSYGPGAFAGSVNIITKKPTKKVLNVDSLFGQFALFGQAFSLSLPKKEFSSRVSFEHKISKAARPNTDFEYQTASFYLDKDFGPTKFDTLFGYQKKDFGADSFYSNLYPEEEEHTETIFSRLGSDSDLEPGGLKNNVFLRKHHDKFILKRNSPTSVNYHTTFVYGFNSEFNLPLKYGDCLLGIDSGNEQINSTNLGKHSRVHEAGSIGFVPKLTEKLSADLRARLDHYQVWGEQESFNAGLAYKLNKNLKIKSSFARAFRIPSFTDLYYSDPANKGNPSLSVETSDSYRMGLFFKKGMIDMDVDGFLRQGHNLIDWTRTSTSDPWQATNLGRVDFRGVEFRVQVKPEINFKGLKLDKAAFSYNYTSADKKTAGFHSKYALDILQQQFLLDIYSMAFGFNLDLQLSFKKRYYGEQYFVGNIYLARKVKIRDFSLEPFVRIDNFSNANYTEVAGVLQPRRWLKSGIKFQW